MELLKLIETEVENGSVTEYSETEAKIQDLKNTYGAEVPDCTTKEGYERSKSIALELTKLRTGVEKRRKALKSPVLKFGKMLDSEAKRIIAEISDIEHPHKLAYKSVDEARKQRKLDIENRFVEIRNMYSIAQEFVVQKNPEEIENMINNLADYDVSTETFGKRVEEASLLVADTLEQLSGLQAQAIIAREEAIQIEAERAELEALRAEKAERERLAIEKEKRAQREAYESQLKKEAAENAIKEQKAREEMLERQKLEAEERAKQAKIDAEKRAEQAKIEAERQQALAVERAQKELLAKQEDERKAKEAKAKNEAHREAVRAQALDSMVYCGIEKEVAENLITAIECGDIKNVTINY